MRSYSVFILTAVLISGCSRPKFNNQQDVTKQLDSLQRIVANTNAVYKAMANSTLLRKLAEQSKRQREPFNSLAYRELHIRKDVSPDSIRSLIESLKNGDAILPLLLLRELHSDSYSRLTDSYRIGILVDALSRSKTFNMWGLPHLYTEDASKALIACGDSARRPLTRLLTDKRPAPVYGGKESMEYERYQYRLCDYALFFLEQIKGNKSFVMPVSSTGRDLIIKQFY